NAPLPASPSWRLTFAPRYDQPLGGGYTGFFQVAVNYTSGQNFTLEQDPLAVQPAYTLVDASIGLTAPGNRYNLTVFVKNLFDQNYLTSIGHNSLLSSTANPYDLVGTYNKDASRYFGVTLGYHF
ncbi:MAG TPA: TonB-dependent receptor, partial [Novosphingobium sp.]|nr:TonB-dependent receptor [Novosphingobium sp.]